MNPWKLSLIVPSETMIPLTKEQLDEIRPKMIKNGVPVRFMYQGQACNITTGEMQKKHINVIYQLHYWHFDKDTSKTIAKLTNTIPIFSE